MMQPKDQHDTAHLLYDLRQQIVQGLLYTHSRLNANTSRTLEATSFLYALIELLEEKGLISIAELDERKRVVGQRLVERLRQSGNGVMLQEPVYDKYTFEQTVQIDCENRLDLCKAACCRLPFALSKQDIHEGVVHWDLGQPYLIEQGADGYCNHMARDTCRCTVYAHRPVPCRAFDCRKDARIWRDFAQRIPNPALARPDWPHCLTETEAAPGQSEANVP
jgi:hypothetical protein